ncbi:MAG TPA: putative Ig domain-containing protein [Bryobacteraceae bacterium]|nr:putative Ig domain-containing protein [Bryobacteraceae bacterium]
MSTVHINLAMAALFGASAFAQAGPKIGTTSLPNGSVGQPYNQTLAATGGMQPYTWSIILGSLPAGLHLAASGNISGTPSTAGNSNFAVQVIDANRASDLQALSITVTAAPSIATSALPAATAGSSYSQQLAASGGSPPYQWSLSAGSLPQGLTLSAAGTISGTPSAAGNSSFTVQVNDSSGATATEQLSITVTPAPLTITTSSLPNGMAGAGYSQTLAASGGTGGYSWSISSGSLPQGLTLSTAGVISGTPSAAGNSSFTVQVKDNSGATATKQLSITVNPPPLTITTSSLPNGMAGASYSQTLAASGGTGGYTWSISAGSLPQGLTLSVAGTISGTPSAAGNSSLTVQVKDSSGVAAIEPLSITITPAPLTITTSSLPNGMAGASYSQTLAAGGGTGGYTWSISSGSLPQGLTLSAAGTISGTPSAAGNFSFTVQVKDSSGAAATKPLSITVNPPPLTITTSSLPNGMAGSSYSQTLTASGGTGAYTWSISSGSLPPGLTLSAPGIISGTPSAAGTSNFTARAQDTSGATAARQFTIAISAAAITITSPATLPSGEAGAPYSAALSATGGVSPYTWTLAAGQLPPGLTLNTNGTIGGTPVTVGGFAFAVQVSDSSGAKAAGQAGISIRASVAISTPAILASGAAGATYTETMTATGGTPPYRWALTSGALPSGLSLNSASGTISGTPSQTGAFQIALAVTDAASGTASGNFSLTVVNGMVITTAPMLPPATVGVAYNLALGAAGGTAPYQWSIIAGSLPAGLAFSASGQLSGTPTASGNFAFTGQATDADSHQVSKSFTLAVAAALTITSAPALPAAATGAVYRQAFSAAGGTPPYVWSVSAGSLPGGMTLDSSTGILSGTPTAAGTFNFTVTVTDSNSVAAQQPFSIAVGQGLSVIAAPTLPDATAGSAYSFTLSASGGKQPYTWTIVQGALPAGLALDASSGAITGTPTTGGSVAFTVQVTDATGLTASHAETLLVDLPALSGLQIAGLPATIASAQQPVVDVTLAQSYPVSLSGVLNLSFTPAGNGPDDPAVQFSTGGRSATFTIAAGAMHATFAAPQFALQTGSVAGTISIAAASLQAGGMSLPVPANVSVSIQVPSAVPSIRSVSLTQTNGGFQVALVGMSNTRELTQATVTFQPASGGSLQTGSLVVALGSASQAWFQDASSAPYGGQFTLTMPFTVNGGSNVVSGVSVVLSNSVGNSSPMGSQ